MEGATVFMAFFLISYYFDSVEDIQWSSVDPSVFATCSADRSIRLWDSRSRVPNDVLRIEGAHDSDVNVITWNRKKEFLLASGGAENFIDFIIISNPRPPGDEGAFKVWDLRMFSGPDRHPLIQMRYHKQPITSISWHPEDESVLICSSMDNLVLFDFPSLNFNLFFTFPSPSLHATLQTLTSTSH